jgi:NodT family efflux transporter outer membrane factor (OMF) lipoprotein
LRKWVRFLTGPIVVCLFGCGCTTLGQWWTNGLKVGPNYVAPPAPVASDWTHAADERVRSAEELCAWWTVFHDPVLDSLIDAAYQQNLDLKKAEQRLLEARFARNVTAGNLLPQQQKDVGGYVHGQISNNLTQTALPSPFDIHFEGMAASWEIDLWGKFRRDVESANADLDAADDNYKDVLVILLGDVAANYVRLRSYQQRLAYAQRNVEIQKGTLESAQQRFKAGKSSEMDVQQARISLTETESTIPPLVTGLWEANNQLCVLLGIPAQDLSGQLKSGPIPVAPPEVMVGIPANLLRRRPDVRRAEREAAAQCARIGVAEADFYPAFSVAGFLGYSSSQLSKLFYPSSFTGFIIPDYSWKILNYGRLRNNVRVEDARFKQKVLDYQAKVLRAGEEVESAIVAFLQSQAQNRALTESVQAADRFATLVLGQYQEGSIDFNRVFSAQETLVRQQDRLATAQQGVALNLIRVYRALGGSWEAFRPETVDRICNPLRRVSKTDLPTCN